ncbi:hypothetical protein ARMGADRAFT_1080005 [Armillaria gallica]|uniref:F-box domain-containing protein n=1 Tax=Armillaria gallica TaxID=47427 RepID=A0A2H3DQH4_ARMGA|nr:hypothetical protein ARMGADRAFT_1080005 [Armillaria gallica]
MGVERLSFDILGSIFAEVCEATDPKGKQHIIIRLSSACSTWRKAALAYPMLWFNIYLPLLSDINPADPRERLLAMYIERSGITPLSIMIRNNPRNTRRQIPFTSSIYTLLHANTHRWQKLDIIGSLVIPVYLCPFLSPASRDMDMLQSLKSVRNYTSESVPIRFMLPWASVFCDWRSYIGS